MESRFLIILIQLCSSVATVTLGSQAATLSADGAISVVSRRLRSGSVEAPESESKVSSSSSEMSLLTSWIFLGSLLESQNS